jgi:hypothetical protein
MNEHSQNMVEMFIGIIKLIMIIIKACQEFNRSPSSMAFYPDWNPRHASTADYMNGENNTHHEICAKG